MRNLKCTVSKHSFLGVILLTMLILSTCSPANPFPLSTPGAYDFGTKGGFTSLYSFVDTSRADREVGLMVWYPAKLPENAPASDYNVDAEPDYNGAPYPIILSSSKMASIFGSHLASHGFVVVGIKGLDSASRWGNWLIDYPLDILAALNYVASTPLKGLEGMIDAERAGVMGYSFDGYDALALSGARVDPEYYLSQCANASIMDPPPEEWWIKYICEMTGRWDEFVANAGTKITTSNDGLWQPMTDPRILAVMPMAPEGAWLFGERGLAAVNRSTLIIGATKDDMNFYDLEAAYIFEHLGTPDKSMISFIDEEHMMVEEYEPVVRMKHFATAFFGHYLQGKGEYAEYFSEKFVSKRDGLAWGVYMGE